MKLELKEESWENLLECIRASTFKTQGNFWTAIQRLEEQFEQQVKENIKIKEKNKIEKKNKTEKHMLATLAKIKGGRKHPTCYECALCKKVQDGWTCTDISIGNVLKEEEILFDQSCKAFIKEDN